MLRSVALLAGLIVSFLICLSTVACGQTLAEWTVMVYLNADNNLEGDGVDDFLEMSDIGSTAAVNVVVQFDRIYFKPTDKKPDWDDTRLGDWGETLRFRVARGMEPTRDSALKGEDALVPAEQNMGDGKTLSAFMAWAMAEYPAKHYALILWDHGNGWRLIGESYARLLRSGFFASLGNSVASLGSSTSALESRSASLRNDLSSLKSGVSALRSQTEALQSSISALKTRAGSVGHPGGGGASLTQLQADVASINSLAAKLTSAGLPQMESLTEKLSSSFSSEAKSVGELVPQARSVIQALNAQLLPEAKAIARQYAADNVTALSEGNLQSSVKAVSTDDTSGGDLLFNREIQDALSALLREKKLDLVGFDACLMAMVETGYAMRGIGNYMVASEELEPGSGWRYDFWLSRLIEQPTMDAAMLCQVIVDSYKQAYNPSGLHVTLSAVDLSKMEPLASAVSSLATALTSSLNDMTVVEAVRLSRESCGIYAKRYNRYHHVDLARFCDQLASRTASSQIGDAAKAVRQAVDASVVGRYSCAYLGEQSIWGSYGLAIYFPSSAAEFGSDPNGSAYRDSNTTYPVEFVQSHQWDNFLTDYFAK